MATANSQMSLEEVIDKRIGEVRTDTLDLSFGEVLSLWSNQELVVQPDFQRLFRWSPEQRSRLVESVLLELPIPQVFVIEREDGVFELIDGLQRLSSIAHFVQPEVIGCEKLQLIGCDLVPELNGRSFEDLSIALRLRMKRATVRTVVIKRQSSPFLRYEMFKRLNTGGSGLSDQDVRNVNARMLGPIGATFYDFLKKCASNTHFAATTESLPAAAKEERGDEELVLRFFTAKNFQDQFRGSIRDWLDNYMEAILLHKMPFNYEAESAAFENLFALLDEKLGAGAFVRYKGQTPTGALAPAYFEAVTIGTLRSINGFKLLSPGDAKERLAATVQSPEFRQATGPGANSKEKLEKRIALVAAAFS